MNGKEIIEQKSTMRSHSLQKWLLLKIQRASSVLGLNTFILFTDTAQHLVSTIFTFRHNEVSVSMHSLTAPTKFSATPFSCTGLHFTEAKMANKAIFFHIFKCFNCNYTGCLYCKSQRWQTYDDFPKNWWILSFASPLQFFDNMT